MTKDTGLYRADIMIDFARAISVKTITFPAFRVSLTHKTHEKHFKSLESVILKIKVEKK